MYVLVVLCKHVKGCVGCMYNIFMDKKCINIHYKNYGNNVNKFTIMKEIILNNKSARNTNFVYVIKHYKISSLWFQNDNK